MKDSMTYQATPETVMGSIPEYAVRCRAFDIMKDSMTYQATLEDGRIEGAQEVLLDMGTQKFGSPDEACHAHLTSIRDRKRLRHMVIAILTANSWHELLGLPEADEPVVVSSTQTSGTSR